MKFVNNAIRMITDSGTPSTHNSIPLAKPDPMSMSSIHCCESNVLEKQWFASIALLS